jgi:hypothetical protein
MYESNRLSTAYHILSDDSRRTCPKENKHLNSRLSSEIIVFRTLSQTMTIVVDDELN